MEEGRDDVNCIRLSARILHTFSATERLPKQTMRQAGLRNWKKGCLHTLGQIGLYMRDEEPHITQVHVVSVCVYFNGALMEHRCTLCAEEARKHNNNDIFQGQKRKWKQKEQQMTPTKGNIIKDGAKTVEREQ